MSRAEERARRRALKQEKFENGRGALVAKVKGDDTPKTAVAPDEVRTARLAPHLLRKVESDEANKEPKLGGSRFASRVQWCVTKKDTEGQWCWGDARAWTQAEWTETLGPAFEGFQQLTWAEIDALGSDSGHKMHHSQELWELHEEAQGRWSYLGLEEFADTIFRFRVGNTRRAWGFVLQAHFYMVWYDRQHKIYVSK